MNQLGSPNIENNVRPAGLKRLAIGVLSALGLEDRARRLYWRLRLCRTVCHVALSGLERKLWAFDQQNYNRITSLNNERHQLEVFLENIRPGDTVWDVGAYVGLYALFASARAEADGTVCAFEPELRARRRLQQNCQLNDARNVGISEFALSDTDGTDRIYFSREDAGVVGSLQKAPNRSASQDIELRIGDHLVSGGILPQPNVIKIDVEGAEGKVIRGLKSVLAHPQCRYVLLEVHEDSLPVFGDSVESVRQELESLGFDVAPEGQRGKEHHWSARKQSQA